MNMYVLLNMFTAIRNTGTISDANGLTHRCETPNAVPVSYIILHAALQHRPYWYSIIHFTIYIYIVFLIIEIFKKQYKCKIHISSCTS
jgi:hypothetical protein